jgi:hypothetical protein
MHELSVCQALIGQVEKVARENDARRVVAITIAVGPLSGVLLGRYCPAEGARELARMAGQTCGTCEHDRIQQEKAANYDREWAEHCRDRQTTPWGGR